MLIDSVLERFAQRSPITVMARLALQRALDPDWIDTLFEQHRQLQYTRELLFSTTVEIMSVVAVGLRPSVHAAAKAYLDLPVSITALYDKINRTDPAVVRALVQGSNERLGPVLQAMAQGQPATVDGYRLRIVDGSHLPASEKRLKPLRQFRGAALPDIRWWSTTRTPAWWSICFPVKMRTPKSVLAWGRYWNEPSPANCGSPTAISAPGP